MFYKKGSDLYSIPFDIPFTYAPLQIDQVPQSMQVQPTRSTRQASVETIEDAVQLYLEAYEKQFTGQYGIRNKRLFLQRFVTFLKGHGHSMKLADLTLDDGQSFLDSLEHAFHGGQMSPATKKRYKCAVRSFSRFLANSRLVEDDLFFALTIG
jgi:site-specific recombinase XerD